MNTLKPLHRAFAAATLALLAWLAFPSASVAQPSDRNYIKEQIKEAGQCRNVAITKSNGDLMICGRNGWAASHCPKSLTNALNQLNEDDELIDDVQLTENGEWLVLYGNNGILWSNIPKEMEDHLRKFNADNEVITSAVFNDAGDWIIITKEHFIASSQDLQDWIKGGMEKYGQIWTCCLTDEAAVVVYDGGYRFLGEVPQTLKDTLGEVDFDVYRLKIAGSAWFISDGKTKYDYTM